MHMLQCDIHNARYVKTNNNNNNNNNNKKHNQTQKQKNTKKKHVHKYNTINVLTPSCCHI